MNSPENIERDPNAPELYFHANIYESADGAERDGWDGILDEDSVDLAYKIISKRVELGIESNPQLIPTTERELVQLVREGVRELVQSRKGTEDNSDMTMATLIPSPQEQDPARDK